MKDIPGFEKTMGDRYAIEHYGERMQAMGFTTFRYHRWFKLVKDEVLLSVGLIPERFGMLTLYMEIQPTLTPFFLRYYASEGASILDLDALRIYEGMKMRDPDHVFGWYPVHDPHLNEMERIFSTVWSRYSAVFIVSGMPLLNFIGYGLFVKETIPAEKSIFTQRQL